MMKKDENFLDNGFWVKSKGIYTLPTHVSVVPKPSLLQYYDIESITDSETDMASSLLDTGYLA